MGDSTRSDRCGSTLFVSPRGRQDISDSFFFTSLPTVFEPVHSNEIFEALLQCEKLAPETTCPRSKLGDNRIRICVSEQRLLNKEGLTVLLLSFLSSDILIAQSTSRFGTSAKSVSWVGLTQFRTRRCSGTRRTCPNQLYQSPTD